MAECGKRRQRAASLEPILLRIACDGLPRISAIARREVRRLRTIPRSTYSVQFPYGTRSFTFSKAKLLILLALPRGLEPLFSP